jgi:hypothetical protein
LSFSKFDQISDELVVLQRDLSYFDGSLIRNYDQKEADRIRVEISRLEKELDDLQGKL